MNSKAQEENIIARIIYDNTIIRKDHFITLSQEFTFTKMTCKFNITFKSDVMPLCRKEVVWLGTKNISYVF